MLRKDKNRLTKLKNARMLNELGRIYNKEEINANLIFVLKQATITH